MRTKGIVAVTEGLPCETTERVIESLSPLETLVIGTDAATIIFLIVPGSIVISVISEVS